MKQNQKDTSTNVKKKREYVIQDSEMMVNIKFSIIAIIAIIIVSAVLTPITFQNDTYYTIKIGEHIIESKTIDMQDPFSWHENLPYYYPHWLYDVITYLIYSLFGFKGIFITTVIITVILGVSTYLLNVKLSNNKLVSLVITVGVMELLKGYITARAQLVSFVFFVLEIIFIEEFLKTKKIRYGIGLFIIATLIANIHSAVWPFFFVLALPYIAEYILNFDYVKVVKKIFFKLSDLKLKYLEKRVKKSNNNEKYIKSLENHNTKAEARRVRIEKIENRLEVRRKKPYKIQMIKEDACKWLIIIMAICILTGFLTPIKDMPFTYTYKIMQGNTTKNISEHLPLTLINNVKLLVVLVIFLVILIFTDVKIRLKDIFLLAGLTLLMFMTRRQESMFLIFCGGILAKLVSQLFEKYDKDGTMEFQRIMTSTVGTLATFTVVVLFMYMNIKPKVKNKFVSEKTYPVHAANYIKENIDMENMHLFNEYNYGSYLLYQGIPVFIDSRCDLYTPQFNKTEENTSGRDIFSDYINTAGISTDYDKMFEKYDITHIILYKNSKLAMLLNKNQEKYNNIYSDESFVIYEILKPTEEQEIYN